jgi:hypothetical protein
VSSYEVETGPIGQGRRSLLLPLLGAVLVVTAAALGTLLPRSAEPTPAAAGPGPDAATVPRAAAPTPWRDPPAEVDCGAMPVFECPDAVDAARLAIGEIPLAVEKAQAWPSLICGDDFDCPRRLLASSDPVGSVALTLSDHDVVWINVFRVPRPNRLDENGEALEARVVRWFRVRA